MGSAGRVAIGAGCNMGVAAAIGSRSRAEMELSARWLLAAKGEMEGGAGGAGRDVGAGVDEVRAGEDEACVGLGRLPVGWLAMPLRISSMGRRRWAWISLRRPSSR